MINSIALILDKVMYKYSLVDYILKLKMILINKLINN